MPSPAGTRCPRVGGTQDGGGGNPHSLRRRGEDKGGRDWEEGTGKGGGEGYGEERGIKEK